MAHVLRPCSAGMYMRLGFSLAIPTNPDILLVDEVLGVGDAQFIPKCQDSISACTRQGKPLVFVTRDLSDPLLNGNLPALTEIFSGSLTASSVITVLGVDGGVHDVVTANDETAGASVQIKPNFENPTDNDVLANRCTTPANTRYGPLSADGGATGNRGTPGLPNVACP